METNYEHARRFVELLTGSAESANTYQVRPERPGCNVRPEVVHGRIDELWPRFEREIQAGAAVSITVNETDLRGRTERNVTKVRALFIDDDGDLNVSVEQLALKLPPSAIVQGKRGIHAYWVLSDFLQLGDFGWRQQGLAAHLGTDTAVKDLARCMRLPGTVNWKDPANPYLVTLAWECNLKYSVAEIVQAFPAAPVERQGSDVDEEEAERRLSLYGPEERYRQARYYIENQAPSAIQGSGGRNTTLAVIWSLHGYGLEEDQIQELAELYNDTKCDPSWSSYDLGRIIADGEGKEVPGSRLWRPKNERPKSADSSTALAAESKQARTTRFVREYAEILFGSKGAIRLNTRSGRITIGDQVLHLDEAVRLARENVGQIAEATYKTKSGEVKVVDLSRDDVRDSIIGVARANGFDPVAEYLNGLPPWDGVDRSGALLDALHVAESSDLYRAFLRRTLIGAVARVFDPGVKCDTICVLHADKGGEGKSTFWRTLFGDDFFADSALDLESKDAAMVMDRVWGIEWSEMGALKGNASRERIKSFLSSKTDVYRRPYASEVTAHPRRSVCVGSTNQSVLLEDDGGNRRFWIIADVGDIDLAWVQEHRDRLWTQAVAEYRAGEQWWLSASEVKEHDRMQVEHVYETMGTEAVARFIASKTAVTTSEIIERLGPGCFGVATPRAGQMAVAKILKGLGWEREPKGAGARRRWVRTATTAVDAPKGRAADGIPRYGDDTVN